MRCVASIQCQMLLLPFAITRTSSKHALQKIRALTATRPRTFRRRHNSDRRGFVLLVENLIKGRIAFRATSCAMGHNNTITIDTKSVQALCATYCRRESQSHFDFSVPHQTPNTQCPACRTHHIFTCSTSVLQSTHRIPSTLRSRASLNLNVALAL